MSATSKDNIVKAIIKVGIVIASADGLDNRERAALVAYASQRSGMTPEAVEMEVSAVKNGLDSITEVDIVALKSLGKAQLGLLINEILQKVASADGELSAGERAALDSLWTRLA
jgi:hypothetical protein